MTAVLVRRRSSALLVTLTLLGLLLSLSAPAPVRAQDVAVRSSYVPPAAPVVGPPPASWPAPAARPATAYVLMDAATGQVLVEHAADEPRAVASTVKVLTALAVVARADVDDPVTVGDEVLAVEGSSVGLEPGETWTVGQLLDAVLSRSGNEAAEALAVHVGGTLEGFLAMMRADAAALGLGDVPIVSPSGLDDANQLSARDLATLARAALADPVLRPFLGRRTVDLPSVGQVATRNELVLTYPDATGVKTGYTSEAGYGLIGSARRDGWELITVVLDAGADPARFEAASTLLDLGFAEYEPGVLASELAYTVAGGTVTMEVEDLPVVTPAQGSPELVWPIAARPPDAPVTVDVDVDGEVVATATGATTSRTAEPTTSVDQDVGRALVDGAYAALRAATVADGLR